MDGIVRVDSDCIVLLKIIQGSMSLDKEVCENDIGRCKSGLSVEVLEVPRSLKFLKPEHLILRPSWSS